MVPLFIDKVIGVVFFIDDGMILFGVDGRDVFKNAIKIDFIN